MVEKGTAIDVPRGIPAVISWVLPALIGAPISESANTVEVVVDVYVSGMLSGSWARTAGSCASSAGGRMPASTGCNEISCGLVTDVGRPSAAGSATSPSATDSVLQDGAALQRGGVLVGQRVRGLGGLVPELVVGVGGGVQREREDQPFAVDDVAGAGRRRRGLEVRAVDRVERLGRWARPVPRWPARRSA